MRTWQIILLAALFDFHVSPLYSQDTTRTNWQAEFSFNPDFIVGGYVQVREFSYEGTRLSLDHDLGITTLNSISVRLAHTFREGSSLDITVEDFFVRGHSVIQENVWFNATNLNGYDGLSVNQTRWFRVKVYWDMPVRIFHGIDTRVGAGLVYDGLMFRIAGTILPGSPRQEPKEDFISQALPYPELGFSIGKTFSGRSSLSLQASGTYIPLFESFFVEGGNMYLRYYTFNSRLAYTYSLNHFYFSPGIQYRMLRTYENSNEDTNDFFIQTFGITLTAGVRF